MSSKPLPNVSTTPSMLSKITPTDLVPHKPITEIAELTAAWRSLDGQANLVSPVASISSIPELHGVSLRAVIIDPTTNTYGQGPEVYRDSRFCEKDEVALGAVALQKISAAAGVQFLSQCRLDDRSDPYYCEMEVALGVRDFDGMWRQVIKTKAVDLRDGAPETLKPERVDDPGGGYKKRTGNMVPLDPSALADRRRHIQSLAETKAFHRALRTILTLKQKYTKAELAKPFVVPKLVAALDSSDPEQKRALIDMALGREAALYGPGHGNEPTRILKDVTPSPTPRRDVVRPTASPDPTQVEVEVVDENNGSSDFELIDLPEPGPVALCDCPCGDQSELTDEVAKLTTERCGAPRCRDCFPGRGFSLDRHKDIRDLRLPKHPGLTAQQIVAAVQKGGRR